jgi:chromosomal replication initiator protein
MSDQQQHYRTIRLDIIKYLETQTDPKKIVSFLGQACISSIDEDSLTITIWVPNEFILVQVKKFFGELLQQAVREVYNAQYGSTIKVVSTLHDHHPIDLKKILLNGADISWVAHNSPITTNSTSRSSASSQVHDDALTRSLTDYFWVLFDRRFQFENYIVWANNEFAYTLMERITQAPGSEYNPFFLHGHVWLGKTHLLQAAANRIIEKYPDKVVVYLPTPKIVDDIIAAIKKNKLDQYKRKFEWVDVLIVDDVQFLANKDKCQEIFFTIFNDFIQHRKQLILSGDRPPRELTLIEARLTTRFALGTTCEISMPDFETRAAIVQSKAETKDLPLSSEFVELIAKTIVDNVRELEWAVNTLATKHHILHRDITHDDVIECLAMLWYQTKRWAAHPSQIQSVWPRIDDVMAVVCDVRDVSREDICSDSKKKHVSMPRQCGMYCAKHYFGRTFERIGEYFGGKHYSSVMYSIDTFDAHLKSDTNLAQQYQRVCTQSWLKH